MSWVATAVVGAAAVGYLASSESASTTASGYQNAAGTYANSSNYAANLSYQQYLDYANMMQPWTQAGANAVGTLADLMGTSGNTGAANYGLLTQGFNYNANTDPLYQWQLSQGLNATQQTSAALGSYFSGGTGVALSNYAENLAANSYQTSFNDWLANNQNLYNMYASLAGAGQTGVSSVGNVGTSTTNAISNDVMASANATSAATIGSANAWANAYSSWGNQAMGGLGTYMNYNMLNNWLNPSTGSYSSSTPLVDTTAGQSASYYNYGY